MKKIFSILLSILILVPTIGTFTHNDIYAEGEYEVAYINDDGSFSTISTYNDFNQAVQAMGENQDYVVRHNGSYSPSKIIAMNSGVVYSYPYRSQSSTINIYQSINSSHVGSGVKTYVAEHYEMTYHNTYYYHGDGRGYVEVTLNGFRGFADLEYTDLVPTKYLEKGIAITLGGKDITGRNEQPFTVTCKQNYYYVKNKDNYSDLVFVYHRAWGENGEDCLQYKLTIGVAPDFMQEDKIYYSDDGINFYNDSKLKEIAGTYYNYYQFLPVRTKTNISVDKLNSYIRAKTDSSSILYNQAECFVEEQNEHGVNAATILCMAIHESGWGKSDISVNKNNLFGWGAFDDATSNATTYASVAACVEAQMGDNLSNYLDVKCSRYFSQSLGNKGGGFITCYASDPYWAEKISSKYYDIDKYANNYNGNLTDYNAYNLALVNTYNAEVKASDYKTTLYSLANKNGYQKNLIVVYLGCESDYSKIQSSNPIDDGEVIYPITLDYGTLVDYNYDSSVVYIKNSDLTLISSKGYLTASPISNAPIATNKVNNSLKIMSYIDSFNLKGNKLTLAGFGLIKKMDFDDASKIKHEIVFVDYDNVENEKAYTLTTLNKNLDLSDGNTYNYVYFEGNIDLSDLDLKNYIVYLRITNGSNTAQTAIKSTDVTFANKVSSINNITYRLTSEQLYSYRFILSKLSTPIDYSKINKPLTRNTLFNLDDISIDSNNNLNIKLTAIIHNVNYVNKDDVSYTLYLIKDKENYKSVKLETIKGNEDYKFALRSNKTLNYMAATGSISLNDMSGTYSLVLGIEVKDAGTTYRDYININNDVGFDLTSKNQSNNIVFSTTTMKNDLSIIAN